MNKDKDITFTKEQVSRIMRAHPTPFHIYEESKIRSNARRLYGAFTWAPGFTNYFAVKACPNPYILEILREEGCGADCSSMPELLLAEKVGMRGKEIMFTSNNTPASEYKKAMELGAIINLDDITHIPFLEKHAGIPDTICFRYNPGPLRETASSNVIGNPQDAKYGLTRPQLFEAYRIMRDKGVQHFGLHTMIASNDLNASSFVETANMLFDLAVELGDNPGIALDFINLGGGIGIPYRPEQSPVDLGQVSVGIRTAYEEKILDNGIAPLNIFMENGRMMTGPFGYLITTVIHEKHTYREYIGVDASMANLMRPGMYGAYHHITVLGKESDPAGYVYDVVGSLCENNDKFAIARALPKIFIGDILAIHNAGAHGHSMGFNYNGKLRSPELLLQRDGVAKLIRRAETVDDHFATLNFPGAQIKMVD